MMKRRHLIINRREKVVVVLSVFFVGTNASVKTLFFG